MKKRLSKKTLISVCTLIAALIIWTMWSNTALMLSTVTVSSNRIPAAFNGFRIAQISDLHNAVFGEDNAELLQILSECEPNIIVITGDLVDAEHTDIDVALDFAKEAVQIADTYYVTGNHEASLSQYDELKAELENTGVVVLEDKAMQLEYNGDDITLIGLSDPSFTLKGNMFGEVPAMVDTKLRGLIGDKDNYTILLSHRPELFEAYVICGVDLVLSGHAHGGQFRLLSSDTFWSPQTTHYNLQLFQEKSTIASQRHDHASFPTFYQLNAWLLIAANITSASITFLSI